MPTITCDYASRCIPCADEEPVFNLSAEQPDEPVFITPFFTSQGCYGWCFSTLSQGAADLCALAQEPYCDGDPPDDPVPPPGGDPGDDDAGDDVPGFSGDTIYWNTLQAVNCPTGQSVVNIALPPDPDYQLSATGMTLAAHSIGSTISQAAADAAALASLTTVFNGAIAQGWIECVFSMTEEHDFRPSCFAFTDPGGDPTIPDFPDAFQTYGLSTIDIVGNDCNIMLDPQGSFCDLDCVSPACSCVSWPDDCACHENYLFIKLHLEPQVDPVTVRVTFTWAYTTSSWSYTVTNCAPGENGTFNSNSNLGVMEAQDVTVFKSGGGSLNHSWSNNVGSGTQTWDYAYGASESVDDYFRIEYHGLHPCTIQIRLEYV